jgi:hypothetical protein
MAKAAIRKLKADRFWRWLSVEVMGKPSPKKPIKQRPPKRVRLRKKDYERAWKRVEAQLERIANGSEV